MRTAYRTCPFCEAACGLLAYVDKDAMRVRKFEGNPLHPASRGRNCAKGPATINQIHDPERILHPLKRAGKRGEGKWTKVSWEQALADIGGRELFGAELPVGVVTGVIGAPYLLWLLARANRVVRGG